MAGMIQLTDATLGYPGVDLLRQVNLEIGPGQICLVHGPNGSGKSTFALSLLGVLPLNQGRLVNTFQKIGYVPQVNRLDRQYPLSLQDIVAMGLSERFSLNPWRRWLDSRSLRHKVVARLESVGLAKQASLHFSRASGGQLQRALIARALIAESDFVVLDEPFSNLDRDGRQQVKEILAQENRERGVAFLVIDHPRDIDGFYQRRFLLQDGRIEKGPGS